MDVTADVEAEVAAEVKAQAATTGAAARMQRITIAVTGGCQASRHTREAYSLHLSRDSLKVIKLHKNKLGNDGATALACICEVPTIKELHLRKVPKKRRVQPPKKASWSKHTWANDWQALLRRH